MFKKGEIVSIVGDEDKELFIIIKTSITVIDGYNILGNPRWKRDRTKMTLKPLSNQRHPGVFDIDKINCEHFMAKKDIKSYSFLD